MKFVILIFALFGLSSCQYFQQKVEEQSIPVAKADDHYLLLEDLDGLIPEELSPTDSLNLTESYIHNWIRKQLMISRALKEINYNQAEIDRKVLNYRYSLIVHEFEKFYINSHLDQEISDEEIESYYQEKPENFLLKQNILKCFYAKIPKGTPGISNFRRNIRGYPNANLEDIREYCFQYAINAFTDEEVWINFDEVISATPLKEVKNQLQFLESTTFSETSDEEFVYFLKILDYKITDELSPIEFVKENIESILVNKRKIELKKELEEAIYDEAKRNGSFEIYPR